jgi:hypothetical protein
LANYNSDHLTAEAKEKLCELAEEQQYQNFLAKEAAVKAAAAREQRETFFELSNLEREQKEIDREKPGIGTQISRFIRFQYGIQQPSRQFSSGDSANNPGERKSRSFSSAVRNKRPPRGRQRGRTQGNRRRG